MNSTVNQCLEAFFTPALSALDEYRCGSCGRVGTSTLPFSISAPPTILMIHLKRLVIQEQIHHQVGFREELDLNPYMTVKGEPLIYELIGVIEHIGSHNAVHYVAFTRREAAWNRCDNTIVSPIALHDVLKCKAYMLMYRAKTTRKRLRAERSVGGMDNAEIGSGQHARQDAPEPKKRPPHWHKSPRIAGEAARIACRSGEGLGTPSPGHEAASGEVKATTSRTLPHPTGLVNSPLVEERREGAKMRVEEELINDPKGESSSMQDSSLDPTAPLPPPPWAESTKDKEPEGRQSLDDPPERAGDSIPAPRRGQPLHPGKAANKYCELPESL